MSIFPQRTSGGAVASPIVIIDSNYLAHRAMWTVGDLSYNGCPTGVLYGFVLQIKKLRRLFPLNTKIIFTWDSRSNVRKSIYQEYKAARRQDPVTVEEAARKEAFYKQMEILRPEVLEPLGYTNHIKEEGFEADDIIASLCLWASTRSDISETFIVSSDHDLYQLLDKATLFQPHTGRNYTAEHLAQEWGVLPSQWSHVLAIAGCDGDGVPGVMGVGVATASKYVTGRKIRPTQLLAIQRAKRMIERNMQLVSLPFGGRDLVPGGFNPLVHKDSVSGKGRVREQFGINV